MIQLDEAKTLVAATGGYAVWRLGYPYSDSKADYIAIFANCGHEHGLISRNTLNRLVVDGDLNLGVFDGSAAHKFTFRNSVP